MIKRNLVGRPFNEHNALIPTPGSIQSYMFNKTKKKVKPQISQRDAYAKAMSGSTSNGVGVGY